MYYLIFVLIAFFQFNDTVESINNDPPVSTQIVVKGSLDLAEYSLINKDGMLLLQGSLSDNSIDISSLEKGLYYVKTMSEHNEPLSFCFAK